MVRFFRRVLLMLSLVTILMIVGFFFMCLILRIFKNANKKKTDKIFKKLQLFSSAAFSLGHGANDAQKTIGLISVMLFTSLQSPEITEGLRHVMAAFFRHRKRLSRSTNRSYLMLPHDGIRHIDWRKERHKDNWHRHCEDNT